MAEIGREGGQSRRIDRPNPPAPTPSHPGHEEHKPPAN
jgi:hypothetical protein